ncbi:MAG: hypothetical protein L3K19_07660 [Thermoplasmata archaeon]|nr:hypothetical protein [Thermoplasmata archaeon]
MDLDSVLQNVQERDKWRHRLATLQRSLRDVTDQRVRVQRKLRRLRRELRKLHDYSDAVLSHTVTPANPQAIHANHHTQLAPR